MNKSFTFSEVARWTLVVFVPLAVGLTLLLGVAYANEQQILRLGANEPQEWLAQEAVSELESGASGAQVAVGAHVLIESNPAPYIVLYDENGMPVMGTGYLHGSLPQIPRGVFDAATNPNGIDEGSNFVTWQPEANVREAIVVDALPISNASPQATPGTSSRTSGVRFVVVGRSLGYTEWQESRLTERTFLGWLGIMFAILVMTLLAVLVFLKTQ